MRSVAWRFALASALPMALLGAFLGVQLRHTIEHRAAGVYGEMTSAMFRMADGYIVQPEDLEPGAQFPPERAKFVDELLKRLVVTPNQLRVRIVAPDGRVVHSTRPADIGVTLPVTAPMRTALAGTPATRFIRGSVAVGAPTERLFEIQIPIKFGTSTTTYGVIIASGLDGDLVASIGRDVRRMQLIVGVAFVALWLIMLPISSSVSRRLRRQSAENEYLALHDTLTGLPNRNLLADRLDHAIAASARTGGQIGLLLIDLDEFKEVNDTLGHRQGDELLVHVAKRLRVAVRQSDTVARLGGDEFAVLVDRLADADELAAVAQRIRRELSAHLAVDGVDVAVQASVGAAIYPLHADHGEQLLQRADIAMYAAKASGTGCVFYSADIDFHSPSKLSMVSDLRRALDCDDGQLYLHYQPVASPADGSVVAVEALVRWEHPRLGHLPPLEFITLAEHSGLIRQLTQRVLDIALAQTRQWIDDGLDLSVCVNLSARDLRDRSTVDDVSAALALHEVPADRLELEITETAVLASPEAAVAVIDELRQLGVRIALDDFGTGYSSLTYLKRLRPDRLKIDRSFVDGMTDETTDAQIVRSVIDLAHSLDIGVTAEGVETEAHWQLLDELSCDLIQGYYLARPLPAAEASAWLHQRAGILASAHNGDDGAWR